MSAPQIVVLIGLMGSGKTTVGKRIAREIGSPFIDLDDAVTASDGRQVREIFSQDGEEIFRDKETAALKDALLSTHQSVVLATGGGAVIRDVNRKLIRDHATHVVWLDATLDDLVQRTRLGGNRPLLDGDARTTLAALHLAREDWYQEIATIRLSTHDLSPQDVVTSVIEAITPTV